MTPIVYLASIASIGFLAGFVSHAVVDRLATATVMRRNRADLRIALKRRN